SRSDGPGAGCGYGPRLPLLMISPYAKENYVSHVLTDQTSILRFIEDNWLGGERISAISFDRIAGSLADMFDFSRPRIRRLPLDPATGLPRRPGRSSADRSWESVAPRTARRGGGPDRGRAARRRAGLVRSARAYPQRGCSSGWTPSDIFPTIS